MFWAYIDTDSARYDEAAAKAVAQDSWDELSERAHDAYRWVFGKTCPLPVISRDDDGPDYEAKILARQERERFGL